MPRSVLGTPGTRAPPHPPALLLWSVKLWGLGFQYNVAEKGQRGRALPRCRLPLLPPLQHSWNTLNGALGFLSVS